MSPAEALQLSRSQATPHAREYQLIRSLFNPVRQLYLNNTPFIRPFTIDLTDPGQVEILRKANQAIYMTSIFHWGDWTPGHGPELSRGFCS